MGFVVVVAATLVLVGALVLRSLEGYFFTQEQQDLTVRAATVRDFVVQIATTASGARPVVGADNELDPLVRAQLAVPANTRFLADRIAQANVEIRFGSPSRGPDGSQTFVPAPDAVFSAALTARPEPGQARERITKRELSIIQESPLFTYAIEVTLSEPYTYKASTLREVTGLLAAVGAGALMLAAVFALLLARRLTTPLRQLTDASRRIAAGELGSRVPDRLARRGGAEVAELAAQFNAMAEQLQESVEIIRRDRDRSREFLADVSHELRTPIAALRTFNELLKEHAAEDPVARDEFLEASGQQIERLDWLAQNLLELSKLDSGLVLLDLRPDDLRAAIESAVEQAEAAARRRGVDLQVELPEAPVRVWHDPQRIGQIVSNLVGNALKFTPRSGSVFVGLRGAGDGAEIEVRDTGVGMDATELPHIFDRFYRGSRSNEARGSGSGLGLAIVKSVMDMHGGRINVESRVGAGTRFMVSLPADPRVGSAPEPENRDAAPRDSDAIPAAQPREPDASVTNSSPTAVPARNDVVPTSVVSHAADPQRQPEMPAVSRTNR
ncbi:MAG: HAMP domain-containing histidine kinase [Chloroflexi bacterium]|nr:HAMP domain-containing histidine kinase [Chloroflexota bacterium]